MIGDHLPTDAGERRAWVFGVARRKMLRAHQSVATAQDPDRLRRFLFQRAPVRGHWVRLSRAWIEAREHQTLPAPVMIPTQASSSSRKRAHAAFRSNRSCPMMALRASGRL